MIRDCTLSSYLGDGAGNFALKQTIDLGTGALEGVLGLGDFDEDGNVDVAYPITFGRNMRLEHHSPYLSR